jgi:SAM-dependent methyltransferase
MLDLCCGPGRHSVELHRRGFAVTSVDRHQPYLDVLHEREPGIEAVCCDMREFVREAAFDAAINLFTSFGYFEDPDDDLRVLTNLRESLRPGGRFLLDTMSKEVFAMQRPAPAYETAEDGAFFLREVELAEDWSSVWATWRLIQDGEVRSFRFFHRLYAGTELRALLLEAGFSEVKLYGALDGRPFDLKARRLVALATA